MRLQLKSFRSARETAAKFSAVRLPLKQRVSSARSFSIQKLAVCHAIAWGAHEVEPSLASATPSVACALRRYFISSMARWLTRRRLAAYRTELVLRCEKGKQSQTKTGSATTEGGAGQIYRKHHPRADWTFTIAIAWLVINRKSRLIAQYQSFPRAGKIPVA